MCVNSQTTFAIHLHPVEMQMLFATYFTLNYKYLVHILQLM